MINKEIIRDYNKEHHEILLATVALRNLLLPKAGNLTRLRMLLEHLEYREGTILDILDHETWKTFGEEKPEFLEAGFNKYVCFYPKNKHYPPHLKILSAYFSGLYRFSLEDESIGTEVFKTFRKSSADAVTVMLYHNDHFDMKRRDTLANTLIYGLSPDEYYSNLNNITLIDLKNNKYEFYVQDKKRYGRDSKVSISKWRVLGEINGYTPVARVSDK